MITFQPEHYKSFEKSNIEGTGLLAYRDITKIIDLYGISMDKVLDLGCASGRSTAFLSEFSKNLFACDVVEHGLEAVKTKITPNVFLNDLSASSYAHGPYSAIFAFFTFLHMADKAEVIDELKRAYTSLEKNGFLVITAATQELFTKSFASVVCVSDAPKQSGDKVKLHLKNIDCEVENHFWHHQDLTQLATEAGFSVAGLHFPLGAETDGQSYQDELTSAPYFCLVLRK